MKKSGEIATWLQEYECIAGATANMAEFPYRGSMRTLIDEKNSLGPGSIVLPPSHSVVYAAFDLGGPPHASPFITFIPNKNNGLWVKAAHNNALSPKKSLERLASENPNRKIIVFAPWDSVISALNDEGTRLDGLNLYLEETGLNRVIELVPCLLYTSPSPRDS